MKRAYLLSFIFLCYAFYALGVSSSALTKEQVETELKTHIHPKPEQNRIGKIVIEDRSTGITQSTWVYVKNALDYYKKNPPLFLILELNTPGGEVFTAQKISDALKEMDTQYNVPVVAFVNNWAISAGAMLAYSSRFISVVKDASMGAAEPVLQDAASGETKTASEKVNSAFRADFANRAHFFDRNPFIAEAMVDKDVILVLRDGKIVKLDAENQIRSSGENPDVIISSKGKLLTLNAEELIDYGVADIYLPPTKLEQITKEEEDSGRWPAQKELLFTYPFFAAIPDAQIDEYKMDWKIRFLSFLTNPAVTSILFLAMMVAFYIELNTPGFGIPGTIALVCLMLIILSSVALEVIDWLEIIMLLSGLALLIIDIFFLPTFGLLGVIGTGLFLMGLFSLLLPGLSSVEFEFDTQTFNAAGEAFLHRLGWLIGAFLLGLVAIGLLARYVMPGIGIFKKFVLEGHEQEGYTAGTIPKEMPAIGLSGTTVTSLRPAGKVEIKGQLYDAMSTGRFIEQGVSVTVVGNEGNTVLVREISS